MAEIIHLPIAPPPKRPPPAAIHQAGGSVLLLPETAVLIGDTLEHMRHAVVTLNGSRAELIAVDLAIKMLGMPQHTMDPLPRPPHPDGHESF